MPHQVHFMRRVRRPDGFRVFEVPVGELRADRARGFLAANKHREPIEYNDPLGWDYLNAKACADLINDRLDELAPRSLDRGSAFACYVPAKKNTRFP